MMGTTFLKSQPPPEARLSTEWQKAKPTLIFHELYSEESSDGQSTPSCRSLKGDPQLVVTAIQETPALQELEETVMQARFADDYKQARKLKARRGSTSFLVSDVADTQTPDPADPRSRFDSWDNLALDTDFDLDPDLETSKKKHDTKRSDDTTTSSERRTSQGSVTSEDSSFGSLASETPKRKKDRKSTKKTKSTKSSKIVDKK